MGVQVLQNLPPRKTSSKISVSSKTQGHLVCEKGVSSHLPFMTIEGKVQRCALGKTRKIWNRPAGIIIRQVTFSCFIIDLI